MPSLIRALLTFLAGVASFYVTLWFIGALLLPEGTPLVIRVVTSLAAAVVVGRFVWRRTTHGEPALWAPVGLGALITGGVGFVGGFFGPLIFAPEANQGPLLGIFITGPLGALLGGIAGGVHWFVRHRR